MEDLCNENERLKDLLKRTEKELHTAAVFGKQLLDSNSDMSKKFDSLSQEYSQKFEKLEQGNHSLQLRIDSKEQMLRSQSTEIETLKEELSKALAHVNKLRKVENENNKKVLQLNEENKVLEREIEELIQERNKWKTMAVLLEEQVKETQQCMEDSIVNEDGKEVQRLQLEVHQLLKSKQELEQTLCDISITLENYKAKEQKLANYTDKLQEEIQCRDYEIASYSSAVEKSKSVIEELQAEIEMMKLQQTDVNLRGNSLFAEVEDRRSAAEKELVILRTHYEVALQKNKIAVQNLQSLKQQLVFLLGTNQKVDVTYTQKLEQSLSQARTEIKELTIRLSELQKIVDNNSVHHSSPVTKNPEDLIFGENYEYMKIMMKELQDETKKVKKELQSVIMIKTAESDQLLQCQKKLFQTEKNNQTLKGEVLNLRLKLQELTKKNKELIKPFKDEADKNDKENKKYQYDFPNKIPPEIVREHNTNYFTENFPPSNGEMKKAEHFTACKIKASYVEGEKKTELTKNCDTVDSVRTNSRYHPVDAPVINVTHDDVNSCVHQ